VLCKFTDLNVDLAGFKVWQG